MQTGRIIEAAIIEDDRLSQGAPDQLEVGGSERWPLGADEQGIGPPFGHIRDDQPDG